MNLEHLPIQKQLIQTIVAAFESHENGLADVLLGSLAKGTGDRVSDADMLILPKTAFILIHRRVFPLLKAVNQFFTSSKGLIRPRLLSKNTSFMI